MKVHTRRHLGMLSLERKVDKIVIADLKACIQKGFDDITHQQRHNLVKANYQDLLKAIIVWPFDTVASISLILYLEFHKVTNFWRTAVRQGVR